MTSERRTDPLAEYQRRRLALADLTRSLVHLARARHDDGLERRARELLGRLAEDRLRLAVAGQFSRGKSTLMNAILGGPYLPTGALPVTSVVTTVTYGSVERARVHRRGSAIPVETSLSELAAYVTRAGSRRAESEVVAADVELPAEFLRLGFAFVDTPGIGSQDFMSTATTRRYLPQADAAVFVTGFDSPLTSREVELLADLRLRIRRLFVVVNKRDLVEPAQAAEVLAYIRAQLGDLGLASLQVHPISALQALTGRQRGDAAAVADSGLASLEDELLGVLTTEKSRLLLDHVAADVHELAEELDSDLRLGSVGVEAPTAAALIKEVETRAATCRDRLHSGLNRLSDRLAEAIARLAQARRAAWRADLHDHLAECVDRAVTQAAGRAGQGRQNARRSEEMVSEAVLHDTRPVIDAWLGRRGAELREAAVNLAGADLEVIMTAPVVTDATGRGDGGHAERTSSGWTPADSPAFAVADPGWSLPSTLGRHPLRSRSPAQWRVAVAAALDHAQETWLDRVIGSLPQVVRDWLEQLRTVGDRQIDDTVRGFRQQLDLPPDPADQAAVAELRAALEAWRGRLAHDPARDGRDVDSPVDAAAVPVPGMAPAPATRTEAFACLVCARLEGRLADRLRTEQLALATRRRAQDDHALAGGFCALHTWEYAALASPLGIAAGYARLAEADAAALQRAVTPGDDAADGAGRVARVRAAAAALNRAGHECRVCAELDDLERGLVARIAGGQRDEARPEPPTLCLPHLVAVLAAGPTPDQAAELTRGAADRLRRLSQDLRSFALNREALHRHLVTDEESRAPMDVLRLVAGHPALARAQVRDDEI